MGDDILQSIDLSVIIPFYKGNQHINHLLDCLNRNQLNSKLLFKEIIIVNDSPDENVKISDNNKRNLPITIISNTENCGIQKSRIRGLKAAKGQYVLMIDQDDLLTDTALKDIDHILQKNSCDMYVFKAYRRKYDGESYIDTLNLPYSMPKSLALSLYVQLIICNQIVSPGQVVLRKDSIPEEWKKNDLPRNGSDDFLLWLMMYHKKCRIAYVKKPLYYHVEYGENFSSDVIKMLKSDNAVLNVLEKEHILTDFQRNILKRKNKYLSLRIEHTLSNNLRIIALYPDVLVSKIIFRILMKILRL